MRVTSSPTGPSYLVMPNSLRLTLNVVAYPIRVSPCMPLPMPVRFMPTVTDDNPRTEDPAAIRAAVLAACPGGREVADRAAAIAAAMNDLQPGDVLAVAGKGHEQGQTIGTEILPFDDVAVVRRLAGLA